MQRTQPIESISSNPDFRPLTSIKGISVDLRYASENNFVGRDLYSPRDCAWLHQQAAEGLEKTVVWLAAKRTNLRVLVLDALRPQRVQEQLWEALQGTDLLGYLANPVRGSIHSFGMAIDITLVNSHGRELDMGTPFDDLSERSHPALEDVMLARGELSKLQIDNRQLLRGAMHVGGFSGIKSEWWHFDCGDRDVVRASFARVL